MRAAWRSATATSAFCGSERKRTSVLTRERGDRGRRPRRIDVLRRDDDQAVNAWTVEHSLDDLRARAAWRVVLRKDRRRHEEVAVPTRDLQQASLRIDRRHVIRRTTRRSVDERDECTLGACTVERDREQPIVVDGLA